MVLCNNPKNEDFGTSKERNVVNITHHMRKERKRVSSSCVWKKMWKEWCCAEKKRGEKGVKGGEEYKGQ